MPVHSLSHYSLFLAFARRDKLDRDAGQYGIRAESTGYSSIQRAGERWMYTPEINGIVALGGNHIGKFFTHTQRSGSWLKRFPGDRGRADQAPQRACREMSLNAGEAHHPLLQRCKTRFTEWISETNRPVLEEVYPDVRSH
jgi:hypothetical protein